MDSELGEGETMMVVEEAVSSQHQSHPSVWEAGLTTRGRARQHASRRLTPAHRNNNHALTENADPITSEELPHK